MKRFFVLWLVLATSHLAGSVLIDAFTARVALRIDVLVTLFCVTLVQTAVLQSLLFPRSKAHESPDQHG